MPEDHRADDRADVVEDGDPWNRRRADVSFFEKVGIEVLGSVRQKHHERHQQNEVRESFGVTAHRAEHLAKRACAMFPPGFRFWYLGTNVQS